VAKDLSEPINHLICFQPNNKNTSFILLSSEKRLLLKKSFQKNLMLKKKLLYPFTPQHKQPQPSIPETKDVILEGNDA